MKIITERENDCFIIRVIGSLDTMTSGELEAELKRVDNSVKLLILDFNELEYLTSVGIRILISANKMMQKQGQLILRGLNEEVSEVLEITGVLEYFTVE